MNQQLPDNVLRDLIRGASRIYQNVMYGSMTGGVQNSTEVINERIAQYVEDNMPDEFRMIKIEVEEIL